MRRAPITLPALGLAAVMSAPVHAEELPVPVQSERLANGLRVVLSPDHTSPTVAIEVFYDVGARVEEPHHSGFAHLFEHMMFQGSANVGKGEHFRLITARGGDLDGRTNQDRTHYADTLPASELGLGLFLEADRMRSLAITRENFEIQRQVVMEERRQSYENRAYALSFLRRDELAYRGYFPYEHGTLGLMADLEGASLDEVRAFHDRFYTPGNAVIAVAGDFEPAQAMALVRQYFDPIPARPAADWQSPPYEAQRDERHESITDAHATAPGLHVAWHIPLRRTPDHYALDMLATVLGSGRSSRLYRQLVRDHEVARSVEVDTEGHRGPDIFTLWCVLAAGHTGDEARAIIDAQLDDVARHGVTARELERARNLTRREFVFGLQSNLTRARRLAVYELYDHNATLVRTELDRYLEVTAADVRRVAGQYFAPSNRTILDVLPPGAR
ncbi:MAG: putative zinc protease [Myxococcaceae bacterium]|nr:putative zinc protease [Myxococcaceae bacterium]